MGMDFIPPGYMTMGAAVDRILAARHGSDWGKRQIELEPEKRDIPGTENANGESLRGQPYDRKAIRLMNEQAQKARADLLEALQNKEFEAMVDRGPLVPIEYWRTNGAATTVHTGALSLGSATKPEDLQFQHRRVLLIVADFEAWLATNYPGAAKTKKGRRQDFEADVKLRNKIETVLQGAERLRSMHNARLGRNALAEELQRDDVIKKTGYKAQTIRKILNGTYGPAKRLNIRGLPGIDPRVT